MAGIPKHGLSQTRIYKTWSGIRARCYNPNSVPYPYYGAKGIKVCPEWNSVPDGFLRFYEWSMQNGYSDDLTIDRIDPGGDYTPNNCRWVDWYTQNTHLSKPPGKSGYYGVSKHVGHPSWYGRVKVYGKCICTGSGATPLEAAIKREKYIIEHGLINRLNGVLPNASD